MQVAQKSPASRQTPTLTRSAFGMLDSMRGEMPKSVFVEELLAKEKRRREREAFYRTAAFLCAACERLNQPPLPNRLPHR